MKLLFGPCSFGCIYYAGVVKYLIENDIVGTGDQVHCVSSGCIAGMSLLLQEPIESLNSYYIDATTQNPFGNMSRITEKGIRSIVKTDERAVSLSGKLHVNYTRFPCFRSTCSVFRSLDELVNICLASCYIPLYFERPIFVNYWPALDGGVVHRTHMDGFVSVHPSDKSTSIHSSTYDHNNFYPYPQDRIESLLIESFNDAKVYFDSVL